MRSARPSQGRSHKAPEAVVPPQSEPPQSEVTPEDERTGSGAEYHVKLPVFEGPLDLLLHLIQKHELDIFDIPVSFITSKYLEYLELMTEMHIDVASEYLVMAATLAHIKSKTLLPDDPDDQEEDELLEEEDPRAELIRRLLEYQKYKDAAERLDGRGALGRDVFLRGSPGPVAEGPAPLAPAGVFDLLDAFAKVLAKAKISVDHEVSFDRLSITERIQQLCERLAGRTSCRFEELFDDQRTRFDLIITFLALLEMTRLKMTRLYQADPLSEIHIELASLDAIDPAYKAGGRGTDGSGDARSGGDREPGHVGSEGVTAGAEAGGAEGTDAEAVGSEAAGSAPVDPIGDETTESLDASCDSEAGRSPKAPAEEPEASDGRKENAQE